MLPTANDALIRLEPMTENSRPSAVDEMNRQDQSLAHRDERLLHRLALTANYDLRAIGHFPCY